MTKKTAPFAVALTLTFTCRADRGQPDLHLQIQSGHLEQITALVSPNHRTVCTFARDDSVVRLWDSGSGRELRHLSGHQGEIVSAAWSPDGETLATAGRDTTIRLWDVRAGTEKLQFTGHQEPVRHLRFSPDGHTIASCDPQKILLWPAHKGAPTISINSSVNSISWSPDSKKLVSDMLAVWSPDSKTLAVVNDEGKVVWDASSGQQVSRLEPQEPVNSNSVVLWDVDQRRPRMHLLGHERRVQRIAWSPDGRRIATGSPSSSNGTVRIWNAQTGRTLRTCNAPRDGIVLLWASNGGELFTGSEDLVGRFRDSRTGRELRRLRGPWWSIQNARMGSEEIGLSWASNQSPRSLLDPSNLSEAHRAQPVFSAWSPKGNALATVYPYGAFIWDSPSGRQKRLLKDRPPRRRDRSEWSFGWSPDGRTILLPQNGNILSVVNVAGEREVASLSGHSAEITDAVWSPTGQQIATSSLDNSLRVWDGRTGQQLLAWEGLLLQTGLLKWSPDATHFISCEDQLRLRDARTSLPERILDRNRANAVDWAPDGLSLVTGGLDSVGRLWQAETGQLLATLEGNSVARLAIRPDGRKLVSCSGSSTNPQLTLWDFPAPNKPTTLIGQGGMIDYLAWSPDSRYLATGGRAGNLELRDSRDGRLLRAFSQSGLLTGVSWSPDAKILATSSGEGSTCLWEPTTGVQLATLVCFPSGDWATVSPQGFFDGTPGSFQQLQWVTGLEAHGLEQFFLEFYQPGLLRDVLHYRKPMAKILEDRKDPRAFLSILKKDRRSVRLLFDSNTLPKGSCRLPQLQLKMKLQVPGRDEFHPRPAGAKDLRVFHNGVLAWRTPPGRALQSGPLNITVPIVAGANQITAYAFNHDNIKSSDLVADISGDPVLTRQKQAWVLCIGIDHYANSDYDLLYAGADATELANALRANLPFAPEAIHVQVLLDHLATRAGILEALASIQRKARPEDSVIISFAGHGLNHSKHYYLLPHDVKAGLEQQQMLKTSLSDKDLEKAFIGLKAAHIALILDSCHSGQALESQEWRVGPMNSPGLAQLAWEKGMDILTASQSNQTAKEISKLGHGLLTYALLEGMRSAQETSTPLPARQWLDQAAARVPQLLDTDHRLQLQTAKLARGMKVIQSASLPLIIQTPRCFHAHEDNADWFVADSSRK